MPQQAENHTPAPLFTQQRLLNWLLIIVLSGVILYVGRTVFIPVSFGLFISFVLYPVCNWMEKKGIGRIAAITISISCLLLLFLLIIYLLFTQVLSFSREWPLLRDKIAETGAAFSNYLYEQWNISKDYQDEWSTQLLENASFNIFGMAKTFIGASMVSLVLFVLIPVYAFLILVYRHRFVIILEKMVPSRINVRDILKQTIHSYFQFIRGMVVVYLIVGILNSTGLLLLGIPHAILFGFIASILTFIPYIGIITASLLPITISWITYNSIVYPLGVIAIFAFVQYLEANVIFPWAVSQKLKLNTLVLIMIIFAGGIIWGASGLILFIPFAAIAKLIAENTPGGETIAMLLGNEAAPKQKKKQ